MYYFFNKKISHEKFSFNVTFYYFYYCLKLYLNKNNKIFQSFSNFKSLF